MHMTDKYINWQQPILKHQNHLPHWQQTQSLQFITWHLGDSISVPARKKLETEKAQWLKQNPKPWSSQTEREYYEKFQGRIQQWLDAGIGSCILRKRENREILTQILWNRNNMDYSLDAFIVMPNHVHVILQIHENQQLEQIMQSLKSVSSHQINKYRKTTGQIWMEDYWDRMIRNETHHFRVRRYIQNNPIKAKLNADEYSLWMK